MPPSSTPTRPAGPEGGAASIDISRPAQESTPDARSRHIARQNTAEGEFQEAVLRRAGVDGVLSDLAAGAANAETPAVAQTEAGQAGQQAAGVDEAATTVLAEGGAPPAAAPGESAVPAREASEAAEAKRPEDVAIETGLKMVEEHVKTLRQKGEKITPQEASLLITLRIAQAAENGDLTPLVKLNALRGLEAMRQLGHIPTISGLEDAIDALQPAVEAAKPKFTAYLQREGLTLQQAEQFALLVGETGLSEEAISQMRGKNFDDLDVQIFGRKLEIGELEKMLNIPPEVQKKHGKGTLLLLLFLPFFLAKQMTDIVIEKQTA